MLCSDGIDNDGDGLIDCLDPDCIINGVANCLACYLDLSSFADTVEYFNQTCPDTTNLYQDVNQALGRFNYDGFNSDAKFVSIGNNGSLQLGFTDNLIGNSGDTIPDIWFYEIGADKEGVYISLRPYDVYTRYLLALSDVEDLDGDGFWDFGELAGGYSPFDLDKFFSETYPKNRLLFDGALLVDIPNSTCQGSSPGSDVDAICATTEFHLEICGNNKDDDEDGLIDENDPDCNCIVDSSIEVIIEGNICRQGLTLIASDSQQEHYQWMKDGNLLEDDTFPELEVFADPGYYELLVYSEGNCSRSDQILIEIPFHESYLREQICFGDSLFYEGEFLKESGDYEFVLSSVADGCDSIIYLNLFVRPEAKRLAERIICEGDSLFFNGLTIRDPGIYEFATFNAFGCDSLVTVVLELEPVPMRSYDFELCSGDTLRFRNGVFIDPGTYKQKVSVIDACDSVLTINITQIETSINSFVQSFCFGDSVRIGNSYFNTPGQYMINLPAASQNGCDSIINATLLYDYSENLFDTLSVCQGDSVEVNGVFYNSDGDYFQLLGANVGCDTILNLKIETIPLVTVDSTVHICVGDVYIIAGQVFNATGDYEILVDSEVGCDSIVQLHLMALSSSESRLAFEICEGDSVMVNDQSYFTEGSYEQLLTNANGCDSLLNIEIELLDTSYRTLKYQICSGEVITVNNVLYESPGEFLQDAVDDKGCPIEILISIIERDNCDQCYSGENQDPKLKVERLNQEWFKVTVPAWSEEEIISHESELAELIHAYLLLSSSKLGWILQDDYNRLITLFSQQVNMDPELFYSKLKNQLKDSQISSTYKLKLEDLKTSILDDLNNMKVGTSFSKSGL